MKPVFKKVVPVLFVLCLLFSSCGNSKSEIKTEKQNDQSQDEQSFDTTNTTLSFKFIDHTKFKQYWTNGTYRCGTDFPAGDYYIMSIYAAGAMCDVSDNPNDFTYSDTWAFRKISVSNGQYVSVQNDGLLVSCDEVDMEHPQQYGIYLVGKDLPEGDYRIKTITDEYKSDFANMSGIWGAYQISEEEPYNKPIECEILFENQAYISVKNGQYLTINDAQMMLVGAETHSETESTTSEEINSISKTEEAFNEANSLTKDDLTWEINSLGEGRWFYKGLQLLYDDCDWIESSLNKAGTVEHGALYRKMAYLVEGAKYANNGYEDWAEILVGFVPETWSEFEPYAENARTFVVQQDEFITIMKKFDSLSSVSGDFDFDYGQFGKFSVDIPDTAACAAELQISEEMLGYILDELTIYAPTITFSGSSCHIEYESKI